MINKLFRKILEAVEDCYGEGFTGYGVLTVIVQSISIIITGASLGTIIVDEGTIPLAFVSAIMVSAIPVVFAMDVVISAIVRHITSGDHAARYFMVSRLVGAEGDVIHSDTDSWLAAFHTLTLIAAAIGVLFVMFLYLPMVAVLIILLVGVIELAKFGYNVSKRLSNHVSDPEAHKE